MKNGVTVIIPTIGRVKKLKNCLESLFTQKIKPQEIIVVDNSTNRETRQFIRQINSNGQIRLRYVLEKRKGASYARNRGIKEAKNGTLAFIDDDCRADSHWIKELLSTHFIHKGRAIVKGENKNGEKNNIFSCLEYYNDELFFRIGYLLKDKNIISKWLDTKNFMINRSLILENKLFFKKYLIFEDLDFAMQARKQNIPIIYCKRARVFHYPRTEALGNIQRWLNKGINYAVIEKNWSKKTKFLSNLEIEQLTRGKIHKKEKQISKELMSDIFNGKKLLYRIWFFLLLKISISVTRAAYYFKSKIKLF